MRYFILSALLLMSATGVFGQKKVSAMANLVEKKSDTIVVPKGKSFVAQLPVHNRSGDDWVLSKPVEKCDFTETMLGQAGMLPNQPEPKLMFFKAKEKGVEVIRFLYKNPKAESGTEPEERTLVVTIN